MPPRTRVHLGSRLVLGLLWLLHFLPLALLAPLGLGLGALLYRLARSRRTIALRNLELCLPELELAARERLARDHFGWLGRSLLERGLLWYASPDRVRRLIQVEGEPQFASSTTEPVMWLVPHFLGLDVAGASVLLHQPRPAASIYQSQSDPVFDAAMRAGRLRFGDAQIFPRRDRVLPLIRAIKDGRAFFNLPDMDFGRRDTAFVPFFGVVASTLIAPSKMARSLGMKVQPVVAEILPGGQGYRVRFLPPWTDWPSDDPVADATAMNQWIEQQVRANPAQYLWVHKRFKTRPEGDPGLYAGPHPR
jgi:Kdo2-lipid IVA lauroyltransferase/acyltransferase